MARARKLPYETTIPPGMVKAVRQQQGKRANLIDDKEAHLVDGPLIARTEREREIHRQWVKDPGEADIQGIDSPMAVEIDRKREAERKKAGETDPPIAPPKPKKRPVRKAKTADPFTPPPSAPPTAKKDPFRRLPDLPQKPGKIGKDGTWAGYIITGGNVGQRAVIHEKIQENFTKAELANTRGLVIDIGSKLRGNLAGVYLDRPNYRPNRAATKKMMSVPGARHFMRIDKNFLQGDVITHEMIHHIRAQRLRDGKTGDQDITKRQSKDLYFDHDREEATTDLESISRHNDFESSSPMAVVMKNGKPTRRIERPSPAGYYFKINSAAGVTAKEAELLDRATITIDKGTPAQRKSLANAGNQLEPSEELRSSGLKGKKLRKRINERFDDTLMGQSKMGKSTRRITGKIENLDQYFAAVKDDGQVVGRLHIRSPKLTDGKATAKNLLGDSTGTGKIVSYNDGKPTTIGRFSNSPKGKFT